MSDLSLLTQIWVEMEGTGPASSSTEMRYRIKQSILRGRSVTRLVPCGVTADATPACTSSKTDDRPRKSSIIEIYCFSLGRSLQFPTFWQLKPFLVSRSKANQKARWSFKM